MANNNNNNNMPCNSRKTEVGQKGNIIIALCMVLSCE